MNNPEQRTWRVRHHSGSPVITDGAETEFFDSERDANLAAVRLNAKEQEVAALRAENEALQGVIDHWLTYATDLAVVHWTLSEANSGDLPAIIEDTLAELLRKFDDPAVSRTAAKAALVVEAKAKTYIDHRHSCALNYQRHQCSCGFDDWLARYDALEEPQR